MSMSRDMEDNTRQMKRIDEVLDGDIANGQEIELKVQKFEQIERGTEERLNSMVSKTVVQELRDVLDTAQELDSPGVSMQSKSQKESLADTVSATTT